MHGLINKAIQGYVRDNYGRKRWREVCCRAGLDFEEFETMLHYDDALTDAVLEETAHSLGMTRDEVLEDVGTYLVSHPNAEAIRRLLRFGGESFREFLHSLDDLPGRARMAVADLDLPSLDLQEHAPDRFSLICRHAWVGFGQVLVGILRALADDYGSLVLLDHRGGGNGAEIIDITLLDSGYAVGRAFELARHAG